MLPSGHALVVVQTGRQIAYPPMQVRGLLPGTEPKHPGTSGGRPLECEERADGHRLARAVGAEKAIELDCVRPPHGGRTQSSRRSLQGRRPGCRRSSHMPRRLAPQPCAPPIAVLTRGRYASHLPMSPGRRTLQLFPTSDAGVECASGPSSPAAAGCARRRWRHGAGCGRRLRAGPPRWRGCRLEAGRRRACRRCAPSTGRSRPRKTPRTW